MGRQRGVAVLPDMRRSRTNLAVLLRDKVHEQVICDWFLMLLSGKNPIIVEDKRFSEQGCRKVIEDPDDLSVPSPERRDQAMKALLDRRDGLPATRVQLDAEVRTAMSRGVIDANVMSQLSPQVLGSLVTLLRGALSPTTSRVIDVVPEVIQIPPVALPAANQTHDAEKAS